MQNQVGRITFGPKLSLADRIEAERRRRDMFASLAKWEGEGQRAHACNCVGPRPGETKCPCMLRGESEKGRRMVEDGVVINGVEYDLVPRKAKG